VKDIKKDRKSPTTVPNPPREREKRAWLVDQIPSLEEEGRKSGKRF